MKKPSKNHQTTMTDEQKQRWAIAAGQRDAKAGGPYRPQMGGCPIHFKYYVIGWNSIINGDCDGSV